MCVFVCALCFGGVGRVCSVEAVVGCRLTGQKTLLRPGYRSGSANIGCAVLSVAAVLFAPSIKCIEQLDEALANVAQLGYGVEAAYGRGLVVAYSLLGRFDFQPFVLDEIAYKTQLFNVFGRI